MKTPPPQPEQAKPAQNGRDLNSAIVACFSSGTETPPFPERFVELIVALTSQQNVSLWCPSQTDEPPQMIAAHKSAELADTLQDLAASVLDQASESSTTQVQVIDRYITATVALPADRTAVLLMEMPANGSVARALAYERLTLLANHSFAQFRHGDMTGQLELVRAASAVAAGDLSRMQSLTDSLARITGADYAAAGLYTGHSIRDVTISGQQGMAKRALLPVKLRGRMEEIARKKMVTDDRIFASGRNSSEGLALILEAPTRNTGMLRIASSIFTQAQHSKPKSRWTGARLVKLGSLLLVIGAVGLIPIADGVDVAATVEASQTRIVTAPLTSTIAEILVHDKQSVIAGETVLAKLDTSELDIERIGVVAERANAVLERETARANRNAAVLRNSELEVQRLDAELALLDYQRDSSVIRAPISGIAVLTDLEQRSGASVRQGEALMEVSDPAALRLSLAVVESQISKISETDTGVFRPDFDPGLRLDATVSRISPAVDNSEEIPVIAGKATFNEAPESLRPGLRGVFAIDQEYRPIWEVLYHNIRKWVLLRIWI